MKCIALVQQGVWDMPLKSMPLAIGYLKSTLDVNFSGEVNTQIFNFKGKEAATSMANRIFADRIPDILAISVFGWNFQLAGTLADTFKQLNPNGWVVFGGTHVANQSSRVFQLFPYVDVIVNGEGEFTFVELVRAFLDKNQRLNWMKSKEFRSSMKPDSL